MAMNISHALKTLGELKGVADVLNPANGDLRWELLQQWLKKNPKYEKLLLQCLSSTPSDAVEFLCAQLDLDLKGLSLLDPSGMIRERVEAAIEQLQELYKNRNRASQKALPQ